MPKPTPASALLEVQSAEELAAVLDSGRTLAGVRVQGVDLRPLADALLARTDLDGLVVLGGRMGKKLAHHLLHRGVLVFPTDPSAPVDPYRARLYQPEELYTGLASGYDATPDARAYHWFCDPLIAHDALVTTMRAIHDDAMGSALTDLLDDLPVVGVMGGHDLRRDTPAYAAAARLGHRLAQADRVVLTGGGPGAMEAANLGAYCRSDTDLDAALAVLSLVPSFTPDIGAWARSALEVRHRIQDGSLDPEADPMPRSVGVPTWFYGHEPPNVFCDGIAKYFSNALREDGLLARCTAGLVVLPGAAGTVQEIFQAVTPLYYSPPERVLPPLVLVGVEHWTQRVPVWTALEALGAGRSLGGAVHLVETVEEAAALVTEVTSRSHALAGPRGRGPRDDTRVP